MKKVIFVLGMMLSGIGFASEDMQGLQDDLDTLDKELDVLDDDFAQGVLLADASEKDMNRLVLPVFNWFSGISTTNKKDPATVAQSDLDAYNGLFKKYSKVYGVDDELYNYYAFGQQLLGALVAVNAVKSDVSRLGVATDADVVAGKLSPSDLADAQACVTAFSAYDAFAKQAVSRGFKKPFSSLLSDMYAKELAIAQRIVSLKDQIAAPVKPQPQKPKPAALTKTPEEVAMGGILNPLLNAFSGSDTGATDPDSFTAQQAQIYQTSFSDYVKKEGTTGAAYLTYKFGSLILPALAAKNVLETDLLSLGVGEPDDLVATELKPALVTDAQNFTQSFDALQTFLNTAPSSFKSPLPAHLLSQYQELVPFAAKISSLASAALQPETPNPNPPVSPAPVVTSADAFIMKNFSDKNLSTLSLNQVNTLVAGFTATYDSSDTYYSEYKVWAAYVPVRYRQLDLLNKLENDESASVVSAAATAFRVNYLNGFLRIYREEMNAVHGSYASLLSAAALEFGVTDALARLELQKIENNTFSL